MTQPVTPTIDSPSPSSTVDPVTLTVDATASVDESDVAEKATTLLVLAATTSPPFNAAQPINSDGGNQHSNRIICAPRPSTRFFVDLSNRTCKSAKHFRRMYTPTSTICECGLFPAFASQKQSSAPVYALPEPFKRLCLQCLEELDFTHEQGYEEYNCSDLYHGEVSPLFWNDAWASTLEAHYCGYCTPRQLDAIRGAQRHGPESAVDFGRACEWIRSSMYSEMTKRGRKLKKTKK